MLLSMAVAEAFFHKFYVLDPARNVIYRIEIARIDGTLKVAMDMRAFVDDDAFPLRNNV